MLVAAAKINQSSIVPAFDQTRVPRIIQVPSGADKLTSGSTCSPDFPASLLTIYLRTFSVESMTSGCTPLRNMWAIYADRSSRCVYNLSVSAQVRVGPNSDKISFGTPKNCLNVHYALISR